MVSEEMEDLKKIKQAKELLDMGAITVDEFNQIKNKYLKEINESNGKPKKTTTQKALEKAAAQAENTVAREVTKGIMRGLFGQMKGVNDDDNKNLQQLSSSSSKPIEDILIQALSQQSEDIVVKKQSHQNDLSKKNLKLCPACNRRIPSNADQCNFCKTKLKKTQNLKNKEKAENEKHDNMMLQKQGSKICPYCGKKIPKNAIRCKYCKIMLKTYSQNNSPVNTSVHINEDKMNSDKPMQQKHGLKICPICGNKIPINAVRCKYCKTMLKTYSSDNTTSTINHYKDNGSAENNSSECVQELNDDLKKKIENNLDDVCRIFSIPNMGKKFVINKLTNDFTQEEISNKLNQYIDNSEKKSTISNRVAYKRKLMENNINPIPEEHFKIYFIIHDSSFKSKSKFIKYMRSYWGIKEITRFYEEYTSLLKNGIPKEHFEKILENDIEETCDIFSFPNSMRMLGNRYVINKILDKYSEDEIKQKLSSHFNLSIEYLGVIDDTNYETKEKTLTTSLKSNYYNYKLQVNSLKSKFSKKEQNIRELIEKCFPAPQMTNSKFNGIVDECSKVFSHKSESTMTIIESTNVYSDKLKNEIKSNMDSLNEIINKLDSLNEELLIIQSETDDDVGFLLDEMDTLIGSVKNYKCD